MGGKRNQAQRTKNNVKPSSSSRSANLLGNDASKLVGFVALKQNVFAAKTDAFSEEFESIDPNFNVVLKKLNKKDAVTKQKGLQEFIDLCNSADENGCKSVLPYWVKSFCSLALDEDNKVREWAHLAHRAIVVKVGRNLAPHLRVITPVWFVSQYDTYPPAASAASNSFQTTFPNNKMKDVISFCYNEIFNYICDNLLNQTPQTLGKSDSTKEDKEAKYERVLICSLNGYAQFIEKLSSEPNEKFEEANAKLLSSGKFWKYSSHNAPLVRTSWYSAMISLCKNAPSLVKSESKNVAKSVFSNLDETDPLALPLVWEAALHTLLVIKDCSEHVSVEKIIFPKLCSILEKAGQGNAVTIYPNLLPFLGNISSSISDRNHFYFQFFESLQTGLRQPSVKLSHSESEAIINTFLECFRYVIMIQSEDREFCLKITDNHLLKVIKDSVTDTSFKWMLSPLYYGISNLISYWQRTVPTCPGYNCLLQRFWSALPDIFIDPLKEFSMDKSIVAYIFTGHSKFLEAFIKPPTRMKKSLKVKFDEGSTESEPSNDESSAKIEINENVKVNLDKFCTELLRVYYSFTEDCSEELKNASVLQLSTVVKMFGFKFFLESVGLMEVMFCSKLQEWLVGSQVPVEPVLVLTFIALSSISDDKIKQSLLQDLVKVRPDSLIVEAVKLCIDKKKDHRDISDWLKGDNVRQVLLSFTHELDAPHSFKVLKYCLSAHKENDFVLGNVTVVEILRTLTIIISEKTPSEIDLYISLLENVFVKETTSFYKEYGKEMFDLLNILFSILLINHNGQLLTVWKDGLRGVLSVYDVGSSEFKNYLKQCTSHVVKYFSESSGETSVSELHYIVFVVHNLITTSSQRVGQNDEKYKLSAQLCDEFLSLTFDKAKTSWHANIESVCLLAERITGETVFDDHEPDEMAKSKGVWDPLHSVDILPYSQVVLFSVELIYSLLGEKETSEENVDLALEPALSNSELPILQSHLLNFTYSLTLLRSISKHYSSVQQYFKSVKFIDALAPNLKELVQRIVCPSEEFLCQMSTKKDLGGLWSLACETFCSEFLEKVSIKEGDSTGRIITEDLEEDSVRALRLKLREKRTDLATHISFMTWKFTKTCKLQASVAFEVPLGSIGVTELSLSTEIARFLTELIKYSDTSIDSKTWDFIMVATASWIQSICKTKATIYYKEYVAFVVAVCDLFVTVSVYLHSDSKSPEIIKLKGEWDELFASDLQGIIINSWKHLAEICSSCRMDAVSLLHIEKLSDVVCHVVRSGSLSSLESYEVISWAKVANDLILSPSPPVQITMFHILHSMAGQLAKLDVGLDENSTSKLSLSYLKDSLIKTQTVVMAMLQDFKLGVMCLVAPFTDSYVYTRAYLMQWLILLEIFKAGDSQARHLYTQWMKEGDLLKNLVNCLLYLLPDLVVLGSEPNSKKIQEIFSTPPSFTYSGWTSEKLACLSCWVYCNVLRVLPLLSRLWYSESDPKTRDFVDKFTAPFVSPILINEEIAQAKNEEKAFENLSIETLPTARMVTAIYSVEESKTELMIQMAHNHPFSCPKVDITKSVVTSGPSKLNLKQLTLFPTLQNGSLWDCIIVWKNYLDKKFEGVEDCYICYSVLHYGTNQLPKLSCHTCKKKFHAACLYRWFTSSNKVTCPICRNIF